MEGTLLRKLHLLIMMPVLILALFACLKLGTVNAYAQGIGTITVDGGRPKTYSDFDDLTDDLDDYSGKTITVDMLTDWDAAKDKQFDTRMYINDDCKVTFNMHGYMFNRNKVISDDDDYNGELIYVDTGATLTINGSSNDAEKSRVHRNVRIYTGIKQKKAPGTKTINGGCLAGGESCLGAGGIFIDAGKEVTLNDVSIVGCKAYVPYFYGDSHSGYGGGIIITESGTTLTMNNSTITGCLSQRDGGGIYAQNDNNIKIVLDNSSVDGNYADSDGGGINMDGENLSITGKNKSSISSNKTAGYGGGVYFWNDDVELSGDKNGDLVIDGNEAKQGGGIYLQEQDNYLEDLFITNNKSTDKGGGVYVNNDATSINACKITGNNKCGVYITPDCDEDMWIKGATIIKDNTGGNLILKDNSSYLNFNQSDGMDVFIRYEKLPGDKGYDIVNGVTLDYSAQLTADDAGYVVAYSYRDTDQDNGRRLRYIKESQASDTAGRRRQNPEIVTVKTQDIHANTVSTKVYKGGYTADEGGRGTKYQLRSIYAHQTLSGDKDFQTYYTDGYFFVDPVVYNDHLATSSYALAGCGAFLDEYEYEYKHLGARQFMADIGCPDQMIFVNDSNTREPGTDSIGVTIGSKVLQQYKDGSDELEDTDYILIAVGMRSANYKKEWASNVTLGDGSKNNGEAQGFSEAADQTMAAIDYYITRYGLQEAIHQGRVKFWIAGFSRGGATANLTAKRLIEKYCVQTGDPGITVATGNDVFGYTLEAPKGGTDNGEHLGDKTEYYRIHNLVNTGDLVPYVGPGEMGFKRYGVDHYVPGTYIGITDRDTYINRVNSKTTTPGRASGVSGVKTVTTYADNNYLDTKKNKDSEETDSYKAYVSRRDYMIRHLATVAHTTLFTDYFYPYAADSNSDLSSKIGRYDGAKLEDYLANFLPFLQQEACANRNNYAMTPVRVYNEDYSTIQEVARAYFATSGTENKMDRITDALDKITSRLMDKELLLSSVGEYWSRTEGQKFDLINSLWKHADADGAFDGLTSDEYNVLKKYWFTLADTAFNFTDGDWRLGDQGQGDPPFPTGNRWVNGNIGDEGADFFFFQRLIYTMTLIKNADMIININHDRGVGIAWARSYDSYYSDPKTGELKNEYREYKANWVNEDKEFNPDKYTVDVPRAYIKSSDPNAAEPYQQLEKTKNENTRKFNSVNGKQRILLEVGEIYDNVSPADQTQGKGGDVLGEAIFYELIDITDEDHPRPFLKNNLYRGGVDLPRREDGGKYKIITYAMSLGKMSEKATYYITLGHKVTVDNGSGEEASISYYPSGELVTISAVPEGNKYFSHWKVALLNEDGSPVSGAEDIAEVVLGGRQRDAIATFTMPQSGREYADGKKYPEGYALEITAVCKGRIGRIDNPKSSAAVDITPVKGGDVLQTSTMLQFTAGNKTWIPKDDTDTPIRYPITWTYTYENKLYPASDIAYDEVEYTASITVPQGDIADGILFAPTNKLTGILGGNSDRVKKDESGKDCISVSRNDADGSATISITFTATDDSGSHVPPQTDVTLNIRTVDLNMAGDSSYIPPVAVEYHIPQYQDAQTQYTYITIPAPDFEDESFSSWKLDGSGIQLDTAYESTDRIIRVGIPVSERSEYTIDAQYIPVISAITAKVDTPLPQQKMQSEALEDTLKVRITDEYEIDPHYVEINWSPSPPEDGKADYLTCYTATIRIKPDELGKLKARRIGDTEYVETAAIFLYSEGLTVTVNGYAATVDKENNSISYTFPVTTYKLEKVYPPEDVTGIPYGTSKDALSSYLPQVKILLDDGSIMTTTADWGEPGPDPGQADEHSMRTWTVNGSVQLPYGVENPDLIDPDITCKLMVDAAGCVEKAAPSADPGEYLEDVRLTLASETEGAGLYWTTDPQATDDIDQIRTEDSEWHLYDGSVIELNREDATEDETGPDGEPTGRKMIKLRTAAFKDGMRPDGIRSYAYIFKDEVKVPKANDCQYDRGSHIGVRGSRFYTLEPVSGGVSIVEDGDAAATEIGTYSVRAKIKEGFKWEVTDPETGELSYTEEDQTITFTIYEGERFTITYDLNGGSIDGDAGPISKVYTNDTEIILPEPTRKGYTFDYWEDSKGSRSKAGQKYKVLRDNRFTAVWKIVGSPFREGNPLEGAEAAMKKLSNDNDPDGTLFRTLRPYSSKQTSASVTLKWKKVSGAAGYKIYAAKCGSKNKLSRVASVKGTSKMIKTIGGKKLRKGTYYKFIIIAVDNDDIIISSSTVLHAATKGGKVCNYKSVSTKAKKNSVSLEKGKKFKLKAKAIKQSKKLKVKKHKGVRYESSNTDIATVTKNGVIKAKAKGRCYVSAYAQNGVYKRIKVVVK